MTRSAFLITTTALTGLVTTLVLIGCVAQDPEATDASGTSGATDTSDASGTSDTTSGDGAELLAGVLQVRAFTESLEEAAKYAADPNDPPDDVDVNLTPTEYTVAFKRIVLKEIDEESEETLTEVELFAAETVDDALVVDLLNATSLDVLDVEDLSAGTYNQVDIEVFYLDMTVATLYPDTTSYDIPYRMVYEEMGVLEPRDFLLYLEPEWMEDTAELAASVTEAGWYWMEMSDPNHVVAVDGAAAHPEFHVLDLFADDEFWSSEHKVLEGGQINPPLEYDPNDGGVLTIEFDVTGKFNFKDYYDETTDPDGLWEIRRDGGIHPFPPDFNCVPEDVEDPGTAD